VPKQDMKEVLAAAGKDLKQIMLAQSRGADGGGGKQRAPRQPRERAARRPPPVPDSGADA
jgi:hypothetical protein